MLVNFWATWCGPCRAEVPDLVSLQDKYRDQLVILGISEDESGVEPVRQFAAKYNINYTDRHVHAGDSRGVPQRHGAADDLRARSRRQAGAEERRDAERARNRSWNARARRPEDRRADRRWDGKEKVVGLENASAVTGIPGVDLASLSPERKTRSLLALNEEECNCGCHLTVARCRVDDPTCSVSLPQAKAIVEKLGK